VKSLVTLAIAISVGLLTVGLAVVTEYGVSWKNHVVRHMLHAPGQYQLLRAAVFHVAFSNALVLFGAALVSSDAHPQQQPEPF
jgi:H+/Cl- antiporter ClcA